MRWLRKNHKNNIDGALKSKWKNFPY